MAHATVELHEKFSGERIEDWEYDVIRQEMAAVGLHNTARQNGIDEHLPRACYFGVGVLHSAAQGAWSNIARRLDRRVRVEFSEGPSYGYGLEPVQAPAISSFGSLFGAVSPLNTAPSMSFPSLGRVGSADTPAFPFGLIPLGKKIGS